MKVYCVFDEDNDLEIIFQTRTAAQQYKEKQIANARRYHGDNAYPGLETYLSQMISIREYDVHG